MTRLLAHRALRGVEKQMAKSCKCPSGAKRVKGGACLSTRTRKFVKRICKR